MKLEIANGNKSKEFELFNSTNDNIDYMEVLDIIAYELSGGGGSDWAICDDVESVEDFKNLWQIPDGMNVIFNPNPENTENEYFQVPDEILNDKNKIAKYCFENYCEKHYKRHFYIID